MMEYIIGRKEDIKGMDERQRPKSWAEAFFMLETFWNNEVYTLLYNPTITVLHDDSSCRHRQ